jgi:hypothetical protein
MNKKHLKKVLLSFQVSSQIFGVGIFKYAAGDGQLERCEKNLVLPDFVVMTFLDEKSPS